MFITRSSSVAPWLTSGCTGLPPRRMTTTDFKLLRHSAAARGGARSSAARRAPAATTSPRARRPCPVPCAAEGPARPSRARTPPPSPRGCCRCRTSARRRTGCRRSAAGLLQADALVVVRRVVREDVLGQVGVVHQVHRLGADGDADDVAVGAGVVAHEREAVGEELLQQPERRPARRTGHAATAPGCSPSPADSTGGASSSFAFWAAWSASNLIRALFEKCRPHRKAPRIRQTVAVARNSPYATCTAVKKPYASATPAPKANCDPRFDGVVPGSVTM